MNPTLFDDQSPAWLRLPAEPGYHFEREGEAYRITIPGGVLYYAPHFFSEAVTRRLTDYLLANDDYDWASAPWADIDPATVHWQHIQWERHHIRLFGRQTPIPRFSAWYGDSGATYAYSGLRLNPHPWNEGLLYLKGEAERAAGAAFNSVLLNWYRNGEDAMGWHADDEPELGRNPVIASVNLGATRRFLMRRTRHKDHKWELPLTNGALLVMQGEMQHYWQHAIPKERKVSALRINLTFRNIR